MNKKGVSSSVIVIAILLIFFIVVAAIFFFPDALLPKIAEQAKGAERFLPGKYEKEIPEGLNTPEETTKIFDGLYEAFVNAKKGEDCYIKYTSLNLKDYTIKLEYIDEEKGTNMKLINEKKQLVSNLFVSDIQPCIALPKEEDNDLKEGLLKKAEIKEDNEFSYGGNTYNMFDEFPLIYKPKGKNLVCFFTDDKVIDPADGKTVYGDTFWNEGFDDGDMKNRMNKLCK